MSKEIKVTHNGHIITFSEGRDMWDCYAVNIEHKSLAELKRKLDTWDARFRRLTKPLKVVSTGRGWSGEFENLTVVSIDRDQACVWTKSKGGRREKKRLYELMPDNAETREAVAKVLKIDKQREALSQERERIKSELPTLKIEDVREHVDMDNPEEE